MSTRALAAYLLDGPQDVGVAPLVAWAAPVQNTWTQPEIARAWHGLHQVVLGQGLGKGAIEMHRKLGGETHAPKLPGLTSAEALVVSSGAAVAAFRVSEALACPADAPSVDERRAMFETCLRRGPDLFDEFLLETSERSRRDERWQALWARWAAELSSADSWFRRGPGKDLQLQAKALEAAWDSVGLTPPAADRLRPWARHLAVLAILVLVDQTAISRP